ncbi:MAG: DUF6580 family putative transport protein, partial [Prosthecobacter sp.]
MPPADRRSTPMLWVPLLLITCALVLRWLKLESPGMTLLPNFSPWLALAFTGTLVLPRALPWFVWPLAMLGINLAVLGFASALNVESLAIYAMYGAIAFGASRFRQRLGVMQALLGVLLASVVFHVVTNTASWMVEPAYAKSLSGWLQALTTGLPGYAPTWTFFRASLLSDLGFSAML